MLAVISFIFLFISSAYAEVSWTYSIDRTKLSGTALTKFNQSKDLGIKNHNQPIFITSVFTPTNTNYYLIQISTLNSTEASVIKWMVDNDVAKLMTIIKVNNVYDTRIGGNRIDVEQQVIYNPPDLNYSWVLNKSSQ